MAIAQTKAMRILYIALFCFMTTCLSHAGDDECLNKIEALLETPSEKYLFAQKPFVKKIFELECSESEYGHSLYSSDAFVFVHEAAHFEDFQITDEFASEMKPLNLNLYTVNGEHIGNLENTDKLPSVKSLIRPYLEKNKPSFIEEGSIFMAHHDGYIGSEDAMAAENLQGMSTETNGYTHGSIIQARVQPLIQEFLIFKDEFGAETRMPNPLKNKVTQAEGLYYFLYTYNLYLNLLKKDHLEAWTDFYTEKNKIFLKKLFESAVTTLKSIRHCELKNNDSGLNFYITELGNENIEILEDIIGVEAANEIKCLKVELIP